MVKHSMIGKSYYIKLFYFQCLSTYSFKNTGFKDRAQVYSHWGTCCRNRKTSEGLLVNNAVGLLIGSGLAGSEAVADWTDLNVDYDEGETRNETQIRENNRQQRASGNELN